MKARISFLGAAQNEDPRFPREGHNAHSSSLILRAGTPEAAVKAVAKALEEELTARGIRYPVTPRLAKNPSDPPYVTFSMVDKSAAVRWISARLGLRAAETMAVGDSMYAPEAPTQKRLGAWAAAERWGERLSGRPMPLTGNRSDANMEKGLRGMLVLSVGGTADPRMRNAYVMPQQGPEMTRAILEAFASTPAPKP